MWLDQKRSTENFFMRYKSAKDFCDGYCSSSNYSSLKMEHQVCILYLIFFIGILPNPFDTNRPRRLSKSKLVFSKTPRTPRSVTNVGSRKLVMVSRPPRKPRPVPISIRSVPSSVKSTSKVVSSLVLSPLPRWSVPSLSVVITFTTFPSTTVTRSVTRTSLLTSLLLSITLLLKRKYFYIVCCSRCSIQSLFCSLRNKWFAVFFQFWKKKLTTSLWGCRVWK